MHREIDRFRALGAEIVVVGAGESRWIPEFRTRVGVGGPVYADPDGSAHRAAGAPHGKRYLADPRAILRAAKVMAMGIFQKRIEGDPLEQSATFVIVPPGEIVHRSVSRFAGDDPPAGTLLGALEAALGR